jgi:pyruvate ferredoxin oxidoreductase beta subunit
MATVSDKRSMNSPNERDPYNNNSYGTLVDAPYRMVNLPVLDVTDFNERIIRGYEDGTAEDELPADLSVSRSLVPAGTATLRDFSYVAPEIPEYLPDNCTGCMDCVTLCPDTAILGKVKGEKEWEQLLGRIPEESDRELFRKQWSEPRKYFEGPKKKLGEGGKFLIIIDPSKCKGCAECVTVCDDDALRMIPKTEDLMTDIRKSHRYFKEVGPSDERFVNDNLLIDMMLKEQTHIYVGGAGSCAGCGEATALRMLCAATGAKYGNDWGIIAATGCNTVYTSTYPYNPYLVPWSNSLFENAPAFAMGVRMKWDQKGWGDKPMWCIGGDGAMFDIGFQSLSRYPSLLQHGWAGVDQQLHRPEYEDEPARQEVRRQAGAAQGNRADRHDASPHVRRPDHVRSREPLLPRRAGRHGIRRTGPDLLLHHLPARTRCGR